MLKTLLVTTGDPDGIGVEVTAKSLQKIFPKLKCNVVVSLNQNSLKYFTSLYRRPVFVFTKMDAITAAIQKSKMTPKIYLHLRNDSPAAWVFDAAQLALQNKKTMALVTGPISKQTVHKKYPGLLGHTDILKKVSNAPDLRMGFLGSHFNVILATGHIPLNEVESALTPRHLKKSLDLAKNLMKRLSLGNKSIGVLGLNPHASDHGLIGSFEKRTLIPVIDKMRLKSIKILGPLVPDVAFSIRNIKKVGIFLALYHDQGLIPFKYQHGQDSGVHVTLGLPFVRTSVDHGTAKDIFKKDKANPNSMIDALIWGKKLLGAHL